MDRDDIVLWFVRVINDRAPALSTNEIQDIEREARLVWGGSRPYVPKSTRAVGGRLKAQDAMWRSRSWMDRTPGRQRGG